MLASFLIGIREGLEAALIVGLVLGVLSRMRLPSLRKVVWAGVGAAVLLSLLIGGVFQGIGASLEGVGEMVFEGVTMLLAAAVLSWMIFWMQRNSHHFQTDLAEEVSAAASNSRAWVLFSVSFFAVLREGIETALFLSAAAVTSGSGEVLIGGILGLGAAALIGWVLFGATLRLDLKPFFQVTSVLLILFAAGLFAHAIHEFIEVGWIPPILDPLWDLNPILNENSLPGVFLKAVFGYNGDPTLVEAIAYLGYYFLILIALQKVGRNRVRRLGHLPQSK